jgi:DNA polymerase III subunit alpha
MVKPPTKFVGLHAHSNASVFDGLGNATEHIDYAIENGMDALAMTDHGNSNNYPHAHQKELELKKKGQKFKFLPGVEAYYHPDLNEWRATKARIEEEKKDAKAAKKQTREDEASDEAGTTLENEAATKDVSKWANPINRRHHMVLLAKSRKGLQNIFRLVSRSHQEGNFYKFPRIDRKMLKECGEDVIVSSACIAGAFSFDALTEFQGVPFDDLKPELLDDPARMRSVLNRIGNTYDQLTDAVGRENVFAELQYNKLAPQHLVNRALLAFNKQTGAPLVSTADSHYCRPELWKEREIYRKLGRLNYDQINPDLLPKDIDTLKCELYPKNADQMWGAYKEYCGEHSFYDDQVIADSIERSWSIAHDLIGDVQPDTSMKLPSFVIPPGFTAFGALVEFAKEGLRAKCLHKNPKYVERLKHELRVINDMNFSNYFLTMKSIIDIAHAQQLVGAGRGSAAGSLVCYVLGITQIDPLKYGLLFERFISKSRKDMPDIDNDLADRDLLIGGMREKFGTKNIIPISNFNTFQLKSLVKDIGRLYAVPFDEVNAVTGRLDVEVKPHAMQDGENKSIFQLKYDDCLKYSKTFKTFIDKYPVVGENIKVLFKQNKATGRHAGGVLVTENAEENMPLIASKGEIQTPWTEGMHYKHLEKYGFVKFDLLGLETLRMIQRTVELILTRHHGIKNPQWPDVKKYYDENLHPEVIRNDDPHVFKSIFHDARFAGIFQFTQKHTQKFITKFHPENVYDLAVATSIYRPGPLAGKVDKLYIEAKNHPENVKYDHPAIEQVLGSTFGYCVAEGEPIVTERGDVKIEDIKVGDMLPSLNEETNQIEQDEVVCMKYTGVKDVYEIETEHGTLRLSSEHIVYTKRGQLKVSELNIFDEIISIHD